MKCDYCGAEIGGEETCCKHCGAPCARVHDTHNSAQNKEAAVSKSHNDDVGVTVDKEHQISKKADELIPMSSPDISFLKKNQEMRKDANNSWLGCFFLIVIVIIIFAVFANDF